MHHHAVESIRAGEVEMALSSGMNLMLSLEQFIGYCRATMLSRTDRCWSFGARADGYVRGEGAGMVLFVRLVARLKKLKKIN